MVGTSGFTAVDELLTIGVCLDSGWHTWISSDAGAKALNMLMLDQTLLKAPPTAGMDRSAELELALSKRPRDCGEKAFMSSSRVYTYLGFGFMWRVMLPSGLASFTTSGPII